MSKLRRINQPLWVEGANGAGEAMKACQQTDSVQDWAARAPRRLPAWRGNGRLNRPARGVARSLRVFVYGIALTFCLRCAAQDAATRSTEAGSAALQAPRPTLAVVAPGRPADLDPDTLAELCRQIGLHLQRLRAENEQLEAEVKHLAAETAQYLAELIRLEEQNRSLRAENRILKDGLSRLSRPPVITSTEPRPPPQPMVTGAPSVPAARPTALPALPTEAVIKEAPAPPLVPVAAVPGAPVAASSAPPSQVSAPLTHWLTTSSFKRHNNRCPFYRSSVGRPCSATEGKPCKSCGG